MKALLINPVAQSIQEVDITGYEDIIDLIGYTTLTSDELTPSGHRLFFDEECFLRGTRGRFQLDRLIPVSGKAVIALADKDASVIRDVNINTALLEGRIKFI